VEEKVIHSSLFRNIAVQAGFRDTEWKKLVTVWSSISAVVLLAAVFTTIDSYHPDEHWQTIEFANYKLDHHDISKMAWEFPAKMRPWLQPAIYFLIAKASYTVGIQNSFVIAAFFRLFSAFFAWIMLTSMMFCSYHLFNDKSQR
jgi:phosphatidylinositol glycan class B